MTIQSEYIYSSLVNEGTLLIHLYPQWLRQLHEERCIFRSECWEEASGGGMGLNLLFRRLFQDLQYEEQR